MISVAVLGASGRMGSLAVDLIDSEPNLKLHAAMNSRSDRSQMFGADVVLDLTNPDASEELVKTALAAGQKVLIGTSGWSEQKLSRVGQLLESNETAALVVVPNFSVGSMLGQRFAAQAASFFQSVEIVEAHHAGKLDSPSGTAIRTAELISKNRSVQPLVPGLGQAARGEMVNSVPIHSIRLPGISAQQDVIFSAADEVLTISHSVSSIRSYSLGILKSIEFTSTAKGLTIGLDAVMGLR